jgi:hypothetical protein
MDTLQEVKKRSYCGKVADNFAFLEFLASNVANSNRNAKTLTPPYSNSDTVGAVGGGSAGVGSAFTGPSPKKQMRRIEPPVLAPMDPGLVASTIAASAERIAKSKSQERGPERSQEGKAKRGPVKMQPIDPYSLSNVAGGLQLTVHLKQTHGMSQFPDICHMPYP